MESLQATAANLEYALAELTRNGVSDLLEMVQVGFVPRKDAIMLEDQVKILQRKVSQLEKESARKSRTIYHLTKDLQNRRLPTLNDLGKEVIEQHPITEAVHKKQAGKPKEVLYVYHAKRFNPPLKRMEPADYGEKAGTEKNPIIKIVDKEEMDEEVEEDIEEDDDDDDDPVFMNPQVEEEKEDIEEDDEELLKDPFIISKKK